MRNEKNNPELSGVTLRNGSAAQVYKRTSWRTVVSGRRDWTRLSDFWRFSCPLYFFAFFPFVFNGLILLFQSRCSHAQMFRTLVHEFLIFYSHIEWNLLFLKQSPLWQEATWDKPEASIITRDRKKEKWTRATFQSCILTGWEIGNHVVNCW